MVRCEAQRGYVVVDARSVPDRTHSGKAGLVGGAVVGADAESGASRCGVNGVAGCAIPALNCQPYCQPFLVLPAVL